MLLVPPINIHNPVLKTSRATKIFTSILALLLCCSWTSCFDATQCVPYIIKQPSGYLDKMWQNPDLDKHVAVNYDRFSRLDGLITESEQHMKGMQELMLNGAQLDQVYYDAAHGNVRAQHCIQKIEGTLACAGVAIAEEVYSAECSVVELPSCIPKWANADRLIGSSSLSQKHLRRLIAQNYESRAKVLKVDNEVIQAGIQIALTVWMIKDLRAAVLAAEAKAAQRALLDAEAKSLTTKVPLVVAEAGTANVAKSGSTVWDFIKATDKNLTGTTIPKSFELEAGGHKLWVHPNATKHMQEYIGRRPTHGMPINSQTLLTSFREALIQATKQGIQFDTEIVRGNWEFMFSPARSEGLLPVVKHAIYRP